MAYYSKYYYGRLNILTQFEDKFDFVLKGLDNTTMYKKRNFNYGFFEVDYFENEFGLFFHGSLVKYKSLETEDIVNEELHIIDKDTIKNLIVAKSRFFLHLKSGLIIFNPKSNHIPINAFIEIFKEVFESSYQKFFVNVDIQLIEDRIEVFETLRKFDRISKISFYLHPSNPRNSDLWKSVDDRLKSIGVGTYREELIAKDDSEGLRIIEDENTEAKIYMAEDGYGEAQVTGRINGEEKTISTKDNPISINVPSDLDKKENILEILKVKIKEIFDRFY